MNKNDYSCDKYNHLSILLFTIPIIKAYLFDCYIFFMFNSIYLFVGFIYHYSLSKKITNYTKILRILDVICVHTLTPILVYKCYFNNFNALVTIFCISMMAVNYYIFPIIFNRDLPHVVIHILGCFAFIFSLESCYENKNICEFC